MEDKEKEMSSNLQNLRAGLSRKRNDVSIKTNNLPNKKAKSEETKIREPERRNFYVRPIADFDLIIDQLETGCRKCKVSPLKITNLIQAHSPSKSYEGCMRKLSSTKHFDNSFPERLVLSCLHTGIGHSHLEALLDITELPCMAYGPFKVWRETLAIQLKLHCLRAVQNGKTKKRN